VQMDEQEGDVGVGHRPSTVACGRVDAMLDHASAALAAARGAGLTVDRAEVAAVAANVLVRLTGPHPPPVAARLTGATEGLRDPAANLRRELRLASALADAGAPVVAPLGGPHEVGGRVVTLWPWMELDGHAGDAAQAGVALRLCHDALVDLDPHRPAPRAAGHAD
jgi:hypothetical protein